MNNIDKAKYLGNGKIETIFGVTWLSNLSSGCKALILLNHCKDKIINISECGENVLEYIFNLQNGNIYMTYPASSYNMNYQKKIKLHYNGKVKIVEFYEVLEKFK